MLASELQSVIIEFEVKKTIEKNRSFKRGEFWQKFKQWWQKNWSIVALLVYAFLIRAVYPLTESFVFRFDHGKDSLAVMDLILNGNLKFVGPWTSIPGLFFGPAWYYFLGICYLIGNLTPVAGIWGMIGLILWQIWLMDKYFGKLPAVIIATGSLWITISSSAWNPYPLPLVSLGLIIILKKLIEKNEKKDGQKEQLKWYLKQFFWLGFLMALGLHFSSAYAVFYLLIIPAAIGIGKIKINWQRIIAAGAGFLVPSIPQILFELKNNFMEIRAVFDYLFNAESSRASENYSLPFILKSSLGEMKNALIPDLRLGSESLTQTVNLILLIGFLILTLGAIVVFCKKHRSDFKKDRAFLLILGLFIFIPLIGISLLHFNIWYLLGLLPAVVILITYFWKTLPKKIILGWMLIVLIIPIINLYHFFNYDVNDFFANDYMFFKPTKNAIEAIKKDVGNRNFAVFTFVPDIYDFSWQYLWLLGATKGEKLPVYFAYQKEAPIYAKEKPALMERFNYEENSELSEINYYVMGGGVANEELKYFEEWLGMQDDDPRAGRLIMTTEGEAAIQVFAVEQR